MPKSPLTHTVAFYNSLTKSVEPFVPKNPGQVRIYNCGPTVYKRQHLGNMRRFLFSDFLRRSLEFFGYEVQDITNITDVGHLTQDEIDAGEDKLEKAAREQRLTPQAIADKQTTLFYEDLKRLNIKPAHAYPKATAHIAQIQRLISQLIERGHAYVTPSGVYFNVRSFPAYGKLSGNTPESIAAGQRIKIRSEKKHPADFALWIVDPQHLQRWNSPWGVGYPGWHIECSAMALEYLGSDIDIHTGGEDNRFPHHENEVAQSEGATGKPFVRHWMHNAHLLLAGAKVAKREGEQITLDTIAEKGLSPLAFRLLVFGAHYRSKLEFSWEALAAAQENLNAIRQLVRRLLELLSPGSGRSGKVVNKSVLKLFASALAHDLNTPQALATFMDYVRKANARLDKSANAPTAATILATLEALDTVMGIIGPLRDEIEAEEIPAAIKRLAAQREQARAQKKFDAADRLRTQIESQGYSIEDTDRGPRIIKLP